MSSHPTAKNGKRWESIPVGIGCGRYMNSDAEHQRCVVSAPTDDRLHRVQAFPVPVQ